MSCLLFVKPSRRAVSCWTQKASAENQRNTKCWSKFDDLLKIWKRDQSKHGIHLFLTHLHCKCRVIYPPHSHCRCRRDTAWFYWTWIWILLWCDCCQTDRPFHLRSRCCCCTYGAVLYRAWLRKQNRPHSLSSFSIYV